MFETLFNARPGYFNSPGKRRVTANHPVSRSPLAIYMRRVRTYGHGIPNSTYSASSSSP